MNQVDPYRTLGEAMSSLDNGGRFFNLFTTAGDDVVTAAEISKAAGILGSEQTAFVYFTMALRGLSDSDRMHVLESLDESTRRSHDKHQATEVSASTFEAHAVEARSYIIEGHPKRASDEVRSATILFPMMIGNVMTMMPMPVSESCQVYEVHDGPQQVSKPCLIVFARQETTLSSQKMRFGGIAKTMTFGAAADSRTTVYLEPSHFTPLES